jgi:hypothetical protein
LTGGLFRDSMALMNKSTVSGVVGVILLLGFVCAAIAQEVRSFHGRVNWVQGTTMAFTPDSGGSFEVDLSKIDQASYKSLKSGDAITVVGPVTADGKKVVATAIKPDR